MAYRQLNLLKVKSKSLREKLEMRKTDIVHTPSDSKMLALSNNPDAIDGKNPSVVLLDELASVPDDAMYQRLKTGMGLQENPLTIFISTASDNLSSPMYEEYKYITKMIEGKITNDRYFYFCAELDDESEMEDENLWIKAMPLLENEKHRPVILKNIKQDIEEQREKGETTAILIKNFNLWQATHEKTYISVERWNSCKTDEEIDITGTDTYIGIDLARINDISAISMIHMIGDKKMFVDTHGFISTIDSVDVKSKRDKISYKELEYKGYVSFSESESGLIDYGEMIDWLMAYEKEHKLNIKYLVYDKWDADKFLKEAIDRGAKWDALSLDQSFKGLSPNIKQFRYAVFNKQIVHKDNPLLNIAMYNARLKEFNNNVRIDKETRGAKIDSLLALINAFSEAKEHQYKPLSVSEKLAKGKFSF